MRDRLDAKPLPTNNSTTFQSLCDVGNRDMNKTGNFLNESDRKILKYSHIDWPGTDTGSSR